MLHNPHAYGKGCFVQFISTGHGAHVAVNVAARRAWTCKIGKPYMSSMMLHVLTHASVKKATPLCQVK
eukprot:1158773-Pelagomonas_calceolata.AAC.21